MIDESEIRERIEECVRVQRGLLAETAVLREMAELWIATLRRGGKILLFGNGGSAADAQHLACELSGRFYRERPGLAAVALTVNTSSLTAIANDYGYDQVFARQLDGLGGPEDTAVGISTSGGSESVLAALRRAGEIGMGRCGLTGRSGGRMRDLVDLCLRIDSEETPRIQEGHILAGHIICELVEREIFP